MALLAFVKRCHHNVLDLNVTKTKELITGYRKDGGKPKARITHSETPSCVNIWERWTRSLNLI